MKENINGFLVKGKIWVDYKNVYKCVCLCKVCRKKFITNYHALVRMKSCGCARPKQLKPLPKYINGFKTIKCHGYDKKRMVRWATVECKECRKQYDVDPNQLKYRKHCGCIKNGTKVCKYAKSHKRLVQVYKHMMSRCYNKNNKDFHNYGGKGISVCLSWYKKPDNFCKWSLDNGYEDNLTIDRKNNKLGYFPKNCRWADAKTQARNTSRNVLTLEKAIQMRKDKIHMTYKQLSNKYKVSIGTVNSVINYKSWA